MLRHRQHIEKRMFQWEVLKRRALESHFEIPAIHAERVGDVHDHLRTGHLSPERRAIGGKACDAVDDFVVGRPIPEAFHARFPYDMSTPIDIDGGKDEGTSLQWRDGA